ncbi:VOC family protein, partial [Staphylococcus pseudintermedius]|nr:VOC family protein [Staphylococcus pseudintermedius]
TYSVENLEDSVEFYSNILSAKVIYKNKETAHLKIGGQWFALVEEKNTLKVTDNYTHLAFYIEEDKLDEWLNFLKKNNVYILRGRERSEKEKKSIYFKDINGYTFELHSGTLEDRMTFLNSPYNK